MTTPKILVHVTYYAAATYEVDVDNGVVTVVGNPPKVVEDSIAKTSVGDAMDHAPAANTASLMAFGALHKEVADRVTRAVRGPEEPAPTEERDVPLTTTKVGQA